MRDTVCNTGRIEEIPYMKNIQKMVNISLGFYQNAPQFLKHND